MEAKSCFLIQTEREETTECLYVTFVKPILASKTGKTDTNSLIKGKWDLQFYFTLKCNNGFRMSILEVELLINDKTVFIKWINWLLITISLENYHFLFEYMLIVTALMILLNNNVNILWQIIFDPNTFKEYKWKIQSMTGNYSINLHFSSTLSAWHKKVVNYFEYADFGLPQQKID